MSIRTVDHVLMSLPYTWSNNISDYNQSQLVSTKCPLTSRLFPSWKNRTFLKFSNFERDWPVICFGQLTVFLTSAGPGSIRRWLRPQFCPNWLKIYPYIHISTRKLDFRKIQKSMLPCSRFMFMVKIKVRKIWSSISYLKDQASEPLVERRIIHQAEIIPLNTFSLISSGSPRGISPVIIINAVMKHSRSNFKTSFCIWNFPSSLIHKLSTQNLCRNFRGRPEISINWPTSHSWK